MAKILSDQFKSVFSVEDGLEPVFEDRTQHVCSEEGIVLKSDIKARLNRMDCTKSPGRDMVSLYVLKNCSEELSGVLEIIYKKSLAEEEIPVEWRNQI